MKVRWLRALERDMAKARHRLLRRRHQLTPRRHCLLDMVDIRSLVVHRVTPDAAAAGFRGTGRYIALCGAEVIPACMTEPGRFRCEPCLSQSASVPSQRSPARERTCERAPLDQRPQTVAAARSLP